jgi:hypothetical protein
MLLLVLCLWLSLAPILGKHDEKGGYLFLRGGVLRNMFCNVTIKFSYDDLKHG